MGSLILVMWGGDKRKRRSLLNYGVQTISVTLQVPAIAINRLYRICWRDFK